MSSKKPKLAVIETEKSNALDGRRQRSERSRAKILRAMWDLLLEGDMDPSAAAIAERAGVGLRSVFRHFEDLETLYRELVLLAESEIAELFMKPFTSTSWREQILELALRNADIWEKIIVPHTVGELKRFKSTVMMDDYKRARVQELAGVKAILPKDIADYENRLYALDSILSFANWRRLRKDRGLSIKKAKEVILFSSKTILG